MRRFFIDGDEFTNETGNTLASIAKQPSPIHEKNYL